MKKIFLILFVFISATVFGQYPITQNTGSSSSVVKALGGFQTVGGLIPAIYADTTAANISYIAAYANAMISTSDGNYWKRNSTATGWEAIASGGGGSYTAGFGLNLSGSQFLLDTATVSEYYFKNGGNSFGSDTYLGTNDANTLYITTNGVERITVFNDGYLSFGNSSKGSSFNFRTNDASSGIISTQNDATNGYAGISVKSSLGVEGISFGYGNSGASLQPSRGFINYQNAPFAITRFATPIIYFPVVDSSIGFGISNTSPTRKFDFLGTVRFRTFTNITDTSTYKPIVMDANGNMERSTYWYGSGGGGGGSFTAVQSVVSSNDSLYLKGDATNPGTNYVYSTGSLGTNADKGWRAATTVDTTNQQEKSSIVWNGSNFVMASPNLYMRFIGSDTNYIASGDSTLTDYRLFNKYLRIWVNGIKLDTSSTDGYIIIDSTITFHPPIQSTQVAYIEVEDTLKWNLITKESGGGGGGCTGEYLTWGTAGDITEYSTGNFSTTSGGGTAAASGLMPFDEDGWIQCKNTSSSATANPIGLDDNPNNNTAHSLWEYVVFRLSGVYYTIQSGASAVNSGITANTNDWVRLRVVGSTSTVIAEYSTDSGANWNTIRTFSTAATVDLKPKVGLPVASTVCLDVTACNVQ